MGLALVALRPPQAETNANDSYRTIPECLTGSFKKIPPFINICNSDNCKLSNFNHFFKSTS